MVNLRLVISRSLTNRAGSFFKLSSNSPTLLSVVRSAEWIDIEALLLRCWLGGSLKPAPSVSFGIQMLTDENRQTDIEQANHAMYEHKALQLDGASGLTNHRPIHGC